MLGLVVNCYVDAEDEGDYEFHRMKASTMDLADFEAAKAEASNAVESDLQHGESEDEEVAPDIDIQAILRGLEIPPLLALAPFQAPAEPHGTPGGYTGSSAGTMQDLAPARTSGADVHGTPGGCSTSVSPRPESPVPLPASALGVPKMEVLDVLDQRTRPSLDRFRDSRRKLQKVPYNELPRDAVIDVSDEDEGDEEIMRELGVASQGQWTKGETLTVAELNTQYQEKLAAVEERNNQRLSAVQEQVAASNAKTDLILEMLLRMQSAGAAPQPQIQYHVGESSRQAPHPTPVASPPPEAPSTSGAHHDAMGAALREAEDLRTIVRKPAGPSVLTPPPSRVGLQAGTDTASVSVVPTTVVRTGDDPAQHTDMVIVEDTQGSPNDRAAVRMEEDNPAQARRTSDVQMETLDLGSDDDDNDPIQQTQASQAEHAGDLMETEAPAAAERVTNARSSIAEEGADVRSRDSAPPADDEVTHL